MTINAVRVSPVDHFVDNVLTFANQAAVDAANLISAPFRWFSATTWASTSKVPAMGDVWDGQLPATFTVPVTVVDPTLPANQVDAFAAIQVARDALDTALANAAALVPTTITP